MSSRHWLIKFAPFRTPWEEVVARGVFTPRGIRSPEARKHLKTMRLGESALFYRSQREQAIMGLLEVTREAYPDPTSVDPQWLTCDFAPIRTIHPPISLSTLRSAPRLADLPLFLRPRLSVMPLSAPDFEIILSLSES